MGKWKTLLTQVNICYVNKILKIVAFYLKLYGNATNLKKPGKFPHFIQFTKLHSSCTHLFHWRQTPTIFDKDTQLNHLLFVFLKNTYTETNLYSKSIFFLYKKLFKKTKPHTALASRQWLRENFAEQNNQPKPDYPDLNLMDFFLWGYLIVCVYTKNRKTIEELKNAIICHIRRINRDADLYRRVIDNFRLRIGSWRERSVSHMDHLL